MTTRYSSYLIRIWMEDALTVRISLHDTTGETTRTFGSLMELITFFSDELPLVLTKEAKSS